MQSIGSGLGIRRNSLELPLQVLLRLFRSLELLFEVRVGSTSGIELRQLRLIQFHGLGVSRSIGHQRVQLVEEHLLRGSYIGHTCVMCERLDGVQGQPGRGAPMREADVLIEMGRGQPQRVLRAIKAKTAELPETLVCLKN